MCADCCCLSRKVTYVCGQKISSLVIATLALAACTATSEPSSGQLLKQTQETHTLAVGTEGTYRPYSYTDNHGKLVGIEIDIMKLLAEDLGAQVEFTVAPWDGLIAGWMPENTRL